MQCPVCKNQMIEISENGVVLDVCEDGCGAIWFDQFEFKKFDEPHEEATDKLFNIKLNPNSSVDKNKKQSCPRCENMILMRHFFSMKRKVEIDECPQCAGVLLDSGELQQIRALFSSEQEKKKFTQQMIDEKFGDDLRVIHDKSKADYDRIKRALGFISFLSFRR